MTSHKLWRVGATILVVLSATASCSEETPSSGRATAPGNPGVMRCDPVILQVDSVGARFASMSWHGCSEATEWEVLESHRRVGMANGGSTLVTQLEPNHEYSVVVRPLGPTGGAGSESNAVVFTTGALATSSEPMSPHELTLAPAP